VSRKIESKGGAGLAFHAPPRSVPKMAFLDCQNGLALFKCPSRLLLRRYGGATGATGSLIKGHGPYRFLGDEYRI
jgi:hypothetical protein